MMMNTLRATPFSSNYPQTINRDEKAKQSLVFFCIGVSAIFLFCCLFYIWSRIQIVNTGYDINREMKIKSELREENRKLTLELATLKSPVRLEMMAKRNFQMDLPQRNQVLNSAQLAELRLVKSSSVETAQTEKPNQSLKKSILTVEKKPSASSKENLKKVAQNSENKAPTKLNEKITQQAATPKKQNPFEKKPSKTSSAVATTLLKKKKLTEKSSNKVANAAKLQTDFLSQ